MNIRQGPLNELLPEIYPIIASQLPLHATPSTLLALALTNNHISKITLPLVYSRLILKNETDAILVLQKLVDNPPFGRNVRELHIMSDLSVETRNQDPPLDVIRRVENIISKGYLPFIHTLGITLMKRWYFDSDRDFEPVKGFGKLETRFWAQLKKNCPRLRGLILKGFNDDHDDPWLEDSGFLEVPDIANLTIWFDGFKLGQSGSDKLLKNISSLAASLHTLNLKRGLSDFISISQLLELNLPLLRTLSLASFSDVDPAQATAFFERHPSIEFLDISMNDIAVNKRWLSSELPPNLFPNLRHLRAHWGDVRLLTPILNQLLSLSIGGTINAQIPYLLRFILPNGLPNLKSLDIGQMESSSRKNKTIEGSLWYESVEGTFEQAKTNKESRTVFDSFMHSIARATPNLEELGFHGSQFKLSKFVTVADDLNSFPYLSHLYYKEDYDDFSTLTDEEKSIFTSQAMDVAEAVPGLVSITNVATTYLPYLTARIRRRENGELLGIEVGKGYGTKIGYEDEAFPLALHNKK